MTRGHRSAPSKGSTPDPGDGHAMPRLLYLTPGPVPPPVDKLADQFYHLSAVMRGVVLLPVWWRSAQVAAEHVATFPWHQVGAFKYRFLLLHRWPRPLRPVARFWFYVYWGLRTARTEGGFDLIGSYGAGLTGLAAVVLKLLLRRPLFVGIPGVPSQAHLFDQPRVTVAARIRKRLADLLLVTALWADHLRLLFPAQVESYRWLARKPATVVHGWVPVHRIRPHPEVGKTILFLGSPWFLKGADILIAAFRFAREEIDDFELHMVGHFGEAKELRQLVAAAGEEAKVVIRPAVSREEALRLIERCSLLVLPSRTEAMGRVLIEATAAGKPVVAAAVGGIPHYIEHGVNGLLFPAEDSAGLASVIIELGRSANERKELGQRARQRTVDRYNEAAFVVAHHRIASALLKNRRKRRPPADQPRNR